MFEKEVIWFWGKGVDMRGLDAVGLGSFFFCSMALICLCGMDVRWIFAVRNVYVLLFMKRKWWWWWT